jgi:uncharacterized protein YegJ (DUF2314 family)
MPRFNPGDHVKIEFTDDSFREPEWMWLLVDDCDDNSRIVVGRLDNEPIIPTDMHLGQELGVSFDQVRDHRKRGEQ